MCPRESILSSKASSFGGIEIGSLSSKDHFFLRDPSRPSSTVVVPIDIPSASVVAPILLDGAFPINRCPS